MFIFSQISFETCKASTQACQLESANKLIDKYRLPVNSLRVKEYGSCGKGFCTTFEFINETKFKKNLFPAGSEVSVCENLGIESMSRSDKKTISLDGEMRCGDTVGFDFRGAVTCNLASPFLVQGILIPMGTRVRCMKPEGKNGYFLFKEDVTLADQQLRKKTPYGLRNKKFVVIDSDKACGG